MGGRGRRVRLNLTFQSDAMLPYSQGNKDHADVPWPLPARWWRSNTSFPLLHETLSITSNVPGCDIIDNAAKRYRGIVGSLGKAAEPQQGGIGHVMIFVENATCEKFPHLKMDESCECLSPSRSFSLSPFLSFSGSLSHPFSLFCQPCKINLFLLFFTRMKLNVEYLTRYKDTSECIESCVFSFVL